MLELYEGKLSRAVLRGGRRSDAPSLPDKAARQKRHYRWNQSRDPRELLRRSRDLLSHRRDAGEITDEEEELLADISQILPSHTD